MMVIEDSHDHIRYGDGCIKNDSGEGIHVDDVREYDNRGYVWRAPGDVETTVTYPCHC